MTAPPKPDAASIGSYHTPRTVQDASARDLRNIAGAFALDRPVTGIEPLGRGLINDTFSVTAGSRRYVMQRINERVFPNPPVIMANLKAVDAHLKRLGDGSVRLPALISTRDGTSWQRDDTGRHWRMMEFIANAVNLPRVERPNQATQVGAILGRFHRSLASLPTEQLGVSLPGFHETPSYLARFRELMAGAGRRGVDPEMEACVEFIASHEGLAGVLHGACEEGRIVQRITHGDPKLDNILFSADGNRAVALIDLDTVQPGLIHHDLGDCLRSCCNHIEEDSSTRAKVRFDLGVCEGILSGYAGETEGLLSGAEIDLLFDGIRLLPFELGLRFLSDHVEGDRYFKVSEPGENLRKARIQFALVDSIESQEVAIRDIIGICFSN